MGGHRYRHVHAPDPLNLYAHQVARLHRLHMRRAGEDHVARVERHRGGEVGGQLGGPGGELAEAPFLLELAIQPEAERKVGLGWNREPQYSPGKLRITGS